MLAPAHTSSVASPVGTQSQRYVVLDALRGVAAIAVVVFHAEAFGFAPHLLPHGYISVDFFFVLSGFVIAHAYEAKLANGLSFNDFCLRRIIRLYPLALLGLALGTALILLKAVFVPSIASAPLSELVWATGSNILLVPDFFSNAAPGGDLFPANGPLWSLSLELLINILWGAFAVAMSLRCMLPLLAWAAVAFALASLSLGHADGGAFRESAFAGLARVSFGFMAGVLVYRLRHRWVLPNLHWGIIAGVLVLLMVPEFGSAKVAWDLMVVLFVLPVLVWIAAQQVADNQLARRLGDLSYPIYVLHWPFFVLVSGVHQVLGEPLHPYLLGAVSLVALVVVSYLALKFYDEPVRQHLTSRARLWFAQGRGS